MVEILSTIGGTAALIKAGYDSKQGKPLTDEQSANLLAQTDAIAASYAAKLGPAGAGASFTAATLALTTQSFVFAQDASAAFKNPGFGTITSALGDLVTALGDGIQAVSSLAQYDPELAPLSKALNSASTFIDILGLAFVDPEFVGKTLQVGTNALLDEAKTVIGNVLSQTNNALENYLSEEPELKPSMPSTYQVVGSLKNLSTFDLNALNSYEAKGDSTNLNPQGFQTILGEMNNSYFHEFYNYVPSSTDITESQEGTSGAAVLTSDGLYASGRLVFKSNGAVADLVNMQDGTSQAVSINLNGAVVTSDYAGPGGSGGLIQREVNFQNGMSEVLMPNGTGGLNVTRYSSSNGTGDVVGGNGGQGTGSSTTNQAGTATFEYVGQPFSSIYGGNYTGDRVTIDVTVDDYTPNSTGQIYGSQGQSDPYVAASTISIGGLTEDATTRTTFHVTNGSVDQWEVAGNGASTGMYISSYSGDNVISTQPKDEVGTTYYDNHYGQNAINPGSWSLISYKPGT